MQSSAFWIYAQPQPNTRGALDTLDAAMLQLSIFRLKYMFSEGLEIKPSCRR